MQWEKHNTPNTSSISDRSVSSDQQQGCPLLNVVGANKHGMVLESRCDFDIGSALTIGFHVEFCLPDGGNGRDSSFISVESIVVESHPEVASDGCLVYRLTLMFSDISNKDRGLLVKASEGGVSSPRPSANPQFGLN